jgi:hypothetical protein
MATRKASPGPWVPAAYEDEDIRAMRALAAGVASDTQQKRALNWIVNDAAGYYDLSFRPGPDGARATDFAEGKRSVGAQIVKLTKATPRT